MIPISFLKKFNYFLPWLMWIPARFPPNQLPILVAIWYTIRGISSQNLYYCKASLRGGWYKSTTLSCLICFSSFLLLLSIDTFAILIWYCLCNTDSEYYPTGLSNSYMHISHELGLNRLLVAPMLISYDGPNESVITYIIKL